MVILLMVRDLDSSGEATKRVQEYGTEFRRRIPSLCLAKHLIIGTAVEFFSALP
jgi:hypothetical protein